MPGEQQDDIPCGCSCLEVLPTVVEGAGIGSVPPELAQGEGDGGGRLRSRGGRAARDGLPQPLGDAGKRLLLPLALQERSAP